MMSYGAAKMLLLILDAALSLGGKLVELGCQHCPALRDATPEPLDAVGKAKAKARERVRGAKK